KHDRKTVEEEKNIKLTMRQKPSFGQTIIEKRGREGTKKQKITLELNWEKVSLRAPQRPGFYAGELPALEETIVHVWGVNSQTQELIEWFLYTDMPVNSLEDASNY
ncbi:MAG TPA: hypothetical protein VN922_00115, partial [Bacteroidia bacterium]|nr:hypothetical protein [Bacteroidia bacterium]